jgi:hypothetical protein
MKISEEHIHRQVYNCNSQQEEIETEQNVLYEVELQILLISEKSCPFADEQVSVGQKCEAKKQRKINENELVLTNWFMTNYV